MIPRACEALCVRVICFTPTSVARAETKDARRWFSRPRFVRSRSAGLPFLVMYTWCSPGRIKYGSRAPSRSAIRSSVGLFQSVSFCWPYIDCGHLFDRFCYAWINIKGIENLDRLILQSSTIRSTFFKNSIKTSYYDTRSRVSSLFTQPKSPPPPGVSSPLHKVDNTLDLVVGVEYTSNLHVQPSAHSAEESTSCHLVWLLPSSWLIRLDEWCTRTRCLLHACALRVLSGENFSFHHGRQPSKVSADVAIGGCPRDWPTHWRFVVFHVSVCCFVLSEKYTS